MNLCDLIDKVIEQTHNDPRNESFNGQLIAGAILELKNSVDELTLELRAQDERNRK